MFRLFSIKKKGGDFALYDAKGNKVETWKFNPIADSEGTVTDQETLEQILNWLEKQNKIREIIVYPAPNGWEVIIRE